MTDRVAYRGARGGPKVCRLGKVTQVDQARAQIGVHRYLLEAGGVRIKWVLAYLDETGSLTSHEGTKPAHESISVKDVICKVDVNRDGVLAAASARKLDKGGYSLQEHTAVALCSQDPGLLDVDKALAELLCDGGSVLAASSRSHETAQVEAWIFKFFRGGVADILEVSWGAPVVSEAARLSSRSFASPDSPVRFVGTWRASPRRRAPLPAGGSHGGWTLGEQSSELLLILVLCQG